MNRLRAFVDLPPVSLALAAVIIPAGLCVWLGIGLAGLAGAVWQTAREMW